MSAIAVAHVGLGPVGLAVVKQVARRRGVQSVAAVDTDPAKVGRDLGSLAGLPRRLRVEVSADLSTTLRRARPDIVVLCTSSSIRTVRPQIAAILQTRTPIVSTTEELSYPWRSHAREARTIDALAKKARAAIVATGVNPGFAMDVLPLMMTAICERVDAVHVERIQDARVRRLPFQQKIGAGLTVDQFRRQVARGTVRHVGFRQSVAMVADALGWRLDRITDEVAPRIANETVSSEFLAVDPGYVCGLVQDGVGYRGRRPVIHLHMEAYLGAPEAFDAIRIEGEPPVSLRIEGGIHGDIATASMVVNSIPHVIAASPGLHTMRDLPLPSFFPGARFSLRRSSS
jgi:hypothetical protein